MKTSEFITALANLPRYHAVFKVIKVPPWAEDYVTVGDYLYSHGSVADLRTESGVCLGLGASYVEFVNYEKIS